MINLEIDTWYRKFKKITVDKEKNGKIYLSNNDVILIKDNELYF